MGTPQEVLERISTILNDGAGDDMTRLIAISKELDEVDYMNEWSPHDAALWATKPRSNREVKLHAFIRDDGYQQGLKWGGIAGALIVGFIWLMWGR
jgi:hypothetical protein